MVMQKVVLTLILAVGIAGCAAQHSGNTAESAGSASARASDFITIALDRPTHFTAADGGPLLAPAGQYVVEPVDESHLLLTSEHSTAPLVIAAALQTHDIDIPIPFVLAFSEKEDEPHVVLLLPGGRALDAVGSFSGIQSRDIIRANRRYSFQRGSENVKSTMGATGAGIAGAAAAVAAIPAPRPEIGAAIGAAIAATNDTIEPAARELKKNPHTLDLESQDKLSTFAVQTLMSDYSQAQALAQSTLAKLNGRFQLEFNTDRPGGDYARRTEGTPESCRAACSADTNCQAFTFVKPPAGVSSGQCFLKRTVPAYVTNPCCISGKRKSAQKEMLGKF